MAADDIDLAMNFGGRRRSRVPMVVGGVLATAVVGGIAWWALGRRGATSEAEPPTDGPPLPTDEPEPPPAAGTLNGPTGQTVIGISSSSPAARRIRTARS